MMRKNYERREREFRKKLECLRILTKFELLQVRTEVFKGFIKEIRLI